MTGYKGDYSQATYKCLDDIRAILSQNSLKRLMFLTPFSPTITTTPTSIMSSTFTGAAAADIAKSAIFAQSISIKVQNMGTATSITVGTSRAQTSTLTAVGDLFVASSQWGTYFDAADIWIAGNLGATTVVEVSGMVYSQNQMLVQYVPGLQV